VARDYDGFELSALRQEMLELYTTTTDGRTDLWLRGLVHASGPYGDLDLQAGRGGELSGQVTLSSYGGDAGTCRFGLTGALANPVVDLFGSLRTPEVVPEGYLCDVDFEVQDRTLVLTLESGGEIETVIVDADRGEIEIHHRNHARRMSARMDTGALHMIVDRDNTIRALLWSRFGERSSLECGIPDDSSNDVYPWL
jgi:hypothetical protein